MTNFRVSFSILEPWSRGDYEEAINRYLRRPTITTPQMAEGKVLHEQWREYTEKTKKLPEVFGGAELVNPECELKMTCQIDDWIEFVGVIDLLDGHTIHDYKTGGANSLKYISSMQLKCYQFLAIENGYVPTVAYINHFNQYTKQVTNSKAYLSDYTKNLARDWIVTYASELHEAIEKIQEYKK